MVHALRESHRVLTPGGILVDARPDSRVPAYAERVTGRRFQRFAIVETVRTEAAIDRASDRAISRVLAEGLFTSQRRGRFWYRVRLGNLASVRRYLSDHLRFVHRARWTVDAPTRRRYATEQFVIRRPIRYEVLESI